MAPELDPIPASAVQSSARSGDLDLAARLSAALVGSPGPLPERLIQALCCSALDSPEGCFVSCLDEAGAATRQRVGPEACFAAYRATLAPAWQEVFHRALESGLPVVRAPHQSNDGCARMGVTLPKSS